METIETISTSPYINLNNYLNLKITQDSKLDFITFVRKIAPILVSDWMMEYFLKKGCLVISPAINGLISILSFLNFFIYYLNKFFFKNEVYPSLLKIFIWDKIFTPLTIILDKLLNYRYGKNVLCVMKRK